MQKQIADLRYMMCERTRMNEENFEELKNLKMLLNQKNHEAGKNKENMGYKENEAIDLDQDVNIMKKEKETLVLQRQELFKEIQRLRDLEQQKSYESKVKADKVGSIEVSIEQTQHQINDNHKYVGMRNDDQQDKNMTLDEVKKETQRTQTKNNKMEMEIDSLRKDCSKV